MSSARKRQKAGKVAALIDNANQQKMLAKHHADVMNAMATEIARRHDSLAHWQNCASAVLAQFISLTAHPDEQEWGLVALKATRLLNMPSNA
jgi:hypothetical protein